MTNEFEDELDLTRETTAQKAPADMAYDTLSSLVDEREVELLNEDEDLVGHKSLSEKIEESPRLSDIQSALKQLYPRSGKDWLDDIQVSRIFPDVYNPLSRIFVKDLLTNSYDNPSGNPDGDLSVAEAIAKVNTPMSIGIDGEGRIDAIAIMGKASEAEIEKEKNKALGLVA